MLISGSRTAETVNHHDHDRTRWKTHAYLWQQDGGTLPEPDMTPPRVRESRHWRHPSERGRTGQWRRLREVLV